MLFGCKGFQFAIYFSECMLRLETNSAADMGRKEFVVPLFSKKTFRFLNAGFALI